MTSSRISRPATYGWDVRHPVGQGDLNRPAVAVPASSDGFQSLYFSFAVGRRDAAIQHRSRTGSCQVAFAVNWMNPAKAPLEFAGGSKVFNVKACSADVCARQYRLWL
jgi:hypothetical protein